MKFIFCIALFLHQFLVLFNWHQPSAPILVVYIFSAVISFTTKVTSACLSSFYSFSHSISIIFPAIGKLRAVLQLWRGILPIFSHIAGQDHNFSQSSSAVPNRYSLNSLSEFIQSISTHLSHSSNPLKFVLSKNFLPVSCRCFLIIFLHPRLFFLIDWSPLWEPYFCQSSIRVDFRNCLFCFLSYWFIGLFDRLL